MGSNSSTPLREPNPRLIGGALALLGLVMFAITVAGYPNFFDNERRLGGYVLDAVQNGNWLAPADATGELVSKPPLLIWLAAAATVLTGRLSAFTMYWPTAFSTTALGVLIFFAGRRAFGWRAGLLAALAYLISPAAEAQMHCPRYDGLLALPVALGALAAFRAWNTGRGWTWFWLACAAGTLVKGPIAIPLSAAGLLAAIWEWRNRQPAAIRGSHWLGVLLYLVICGGWFWAAYQATDGGIAQKQISRELVAHATGGGRGETPFIGFWEPPYNFIVHLLPASLLAVLGLWRVIKHPSPDAAARRLERFLFCWIVGGLLLFCIAAHQRGRLIFPLLPPAALLAGRELARLIEELPRLRRWRDNRTLYRWALGYAVVAVGAVALYHLYLLRFSRNVEQTLAARRFADELRSDYGRHFPISHVDSPFAIQIWLNTMRPSLTMKEAAELAAGPAPVLFAVTEEAKFRTAFGTNAVPPLFELRRVASWPGKEKSGVVLLSNRSDRSWTNDIATLLGPLYLRLRDARLTGVHHYDLTIQPGSGDPSVTVSNTAPDAVIARLRFVDGRTGATTPFVQRRLAPGETWIERPPPAI